MYAIFRIDRKIRDPTLGINGLNPAAITSPNVPQTLFSTILPIGGGEYRLRHEKGIDVLRQEKSIDKV
jgi:hypothetical protein